MAITPLSIIDRIALNYLHRRENPAIKASYVPSGLLPLFGSVGLLGTTGRNKDLERSKYGAALAYHIVGPIYRSVKLRADVVGRTPWQLVNRDNDEVIAKSTDAVPRHPLAKAIMDARDHYSEGLFFLWEASLALYGQNIIEIGANKYGYTAGLRWLNPLGVEIDDSPGYIRQFRYSGNNRTEYFYPDEVLYDRDFSALDDHRGHSPTYAALDKANIELSSNRYWNAHFKNGAIPGGLIQPDEGQERLDEKDVRYIQDGWRKNIKGVDNAGSVAISPVRIDFEQFEAIDLSKQIPLSESMQKQIFNLYGVSRAISGDSESSPYQNNNKAVAQALFETVVEPETTNISESVNLNLVPHFVDDGPSVRFEFDLSGYAVTSEADKTKAEHIKTRVESGILSLYDAQEEAGQKPDKALKDFYLVEGVPIHKDRFEELFDKKYGGTSQAISLSGIDKLFPSGNPTQSAPEVKQPAEEENISTKVSVKADKTPGAVYISLAGNKDVAHIQKQVKDSIGDNADIKWQPSPTHHITLVYSPDVDDATFESIAHHSEIHGSRFVITGRKLEVFENGEERALVLLVDKTPAIEETQMAIHGEFLAPNVEMSKYSDPNAYNPHITLAYLPSDVGIPEVDIQLETLADTIGFSRDDYEPVYEVSHKFEAFKVLLFKERENAVRNELSAWQRFALNGGTKTRAFEAEFTRGDLADQLHTQLEPDLDAAAIKAVFDLVFDKVAIKAYENTRGSYIKAVGSLIKDAQQGTMKRREWSQRMRQAIVLHGVNAFVDGLKDGGVDDEPSDEDEKVIDKLIAEQGSFITGLASNLFGEEGVSDAMADQKPEMWARKSLSPFYYAGLESAANNQMMEFAGPDGEESCKTCSRLKGQRHRLKTWVRKQYVPQQDTKNFKCGGFKCEHILVVVTGKARGRWLRDAPGKWADAA